MLLAAMLALVVVAASPAFAQSGSSIEVEEGDVEISDTTAVEGSIAQNCPASVTLATRTRTFRSFPTRRTLQ